MTAPVVGAVRRAATSAAVTQAAPKGGRVSKERMQEVRREKRAAKKDAASTPAVTKPKSETPQTAPVAKPQEVQGSLPSLSVPQPVSSGAGFILALMFWTWVALPYLNNGGVAGVRAQLKAKFTNKAPDGSWLP
jgi:hypothetical protein